MPVLNKATARRRIRQVFSGYKKLTRPERRHIRNLTGGKLYELYCLSRVLHEIRYRYRYTIQFKGTNLQFQSGPGQIHGTSPHFDLISPVSGQLR